MRLLRLHTLGMLLMALIVLPAVTSCYDYGQEENLPEVPPAPATPKYINVTVSVSASENAFTRAPKGGEYGDKTEEGNDRENEVKNVTLIFYEDDDNNIGINTVSDQVKVKYVKRCLMRRIAGDDLPSDYEHTHKTGESATAQGQEVLYTTGNQRLDDSALELEKPYKLLVLANSYVEVNVGEKIKDVRDKVTNTVYTGSGVGEDATDFVMSSEADATVTLSNPTPEVTSSQISLVYYFPCIHIERLAARIDFDTTGGTYDQDLGGYKYTITGGDIFVLTSVTPFNLYAENEYLFKRVQNNWTDATTTTTYLGDETVDNNNVANNYVVDPKTSLKNNSNTFYYFSSIASDFGSNIYTHSMATSQTSPVIVCYAKENTLMPESQLKKYATGIAFTGEYYPSGIGGSHVTRTYYHYIRHQGEQNDSYEAKLWDELDKAGTGANQPDVSAADVPMNIGIVRNNIYRISLKSEGEGTLKVVVKETKWRHVDNPTIYI